MAVAEQQRLPSEYRRPLCRPRLAIDAASPPAPKAAAKRPAKDAGTRAAKKRRRAAQKRSDHKAGKVRTGLGIAFADEGPSKVTEEPSAEEPEEAKREAQAINGDYKFPSNLRQKLIDEAADEGVSDTEFPFHFRARVPSRQGARGNQRFIVTCVFPDESTRHGQGSRLRVAEEKLVDRVIRHINGQELDATTASDMTLADSTLSSEDGEEEAGPRSSTPDPNDGEPQDALQELLGDLEAVGAPPGLAAELVAVVGDAVDMDEVELDVGGDDELPPDADRADLGAVLAIRLPRHSGQLRQVVLGLLPDLRRLLEEETAGCVWWHLGVSRMLDFVGEFAKNAPSFFRIGTEKGKRLRRDASLAISATAVLSTAMRAARAVDRIPLLLDASASLRAMLAGDDALPEDAALSYTRDDASRDLVDLLASFEDKLCSFL